MAAERVFAETRLLGVPSEADRYMLSGVLIEGIATTIPSAFRLRMAITSGGNCGFTGSRGRSAFGSGREMGVA